MGDIDMPGLAGRMRQIMKAKGWGPTTWSRHAGLSKPAVTNVLTRLDAGNGTPTAETIYRLAKAAGVTGDWLMSGSLSSVAPEYVPNDRYPSRAFVLEAARISGIAAEIRSEVAAMDAGEKDPGRDYWADALDEAIAAMAGKARGLRSR